MEHLLVGLDCSPASLRSVRYLARILTDARHVRVTLFHVLPLISPNLLNKTEVLRIERLHEEHPHLSGYFWTAEDEAKMHATFEEAKALLHSGGIPEAHIATHFRVQSGEIANVLVEAARSLGCSTLVLGRRGLSQVKEFFLGSVSKATTKIARGLTVWIVDS